MRVLLKKPLSVISCHRRRNLADKTNINMHVCMSDKHTDMPLIPQFWLGNLGERSESQGGLGHPSLYGGKINSTAPAESRESWGASGLAMVLLQGEKAACSGFLRLWRTEIWSESAPGAG